MTGLNTTPLAPVSKGEMHSTEHNGSVYYNSHLEYCHFEWYKVVKHILALLSCMFGLVGNSKVIWLLGFCMKRNPFTTYVLNLAVADFCTLSIISVYVFAISVNVEPLFIYSLLDALFFFPYNASISLLTAISVERCLSVLFPFWYRCHRPGHTSTIVSFLLWVLSGLFFGIVLIFATWESYEERIRIISIICSVNVLIFTPFMIGSGLILLIKFSCSSQRRHPARMHAAILITLLFFMIFAIPLSISVFMHFISTFVSHCDVTLGFLFATFNSSINPLIYYLVGRKKKQQSRASMKVALQRLFTDSSEGSEVTEVNT